jgi:glutamyl-tRNA synthetase
MKIKARFAPSPTGEIHLGNARTALFNALLAQHDNASFLLRIEDTDAARSKMEHVTQLINDLHWMGITWTQGPGVQDEQGPYFQSERLPIYQKYYDQLIQSGSAYPCFCSEEQLEMTRKVQRVSGQPPRYPGTCRHLTEKERQDKRDAGIPSSLRFKVPKGAAIRFTDRVRGSQQFFSDDIGDFIILKQDSSASFMFCNAIDDAMMGVTHVMRGEDHLTNTPRQIMILQALGLPVPVYSHISIITAPDGSPLSKRNGSRSIRQLREEGYLPIAVVNYMARLGHAFSDNRLLSLHELGLQFQLSSLSSSAAKYDPQQLLYWQKQAVSQLDAASFWKWVGSDCYAQVPEEKRNLFGTILKENITFPAEAAAWIRIYCEPTLALSETAIACIQTAPKALFEISCDSLKTHGLDFDALSKQVGSTLNIKGKALFQPLRYALTNQEHGPKMGEVLNLLGATLVMDRLLAAQNIAQG